MKFSQKKKQEKLYQQWAEHSDLPPEAIPPEESPQNVSAGEERDRRSHRILYIVLGIGIVILCVGLVLIFTQ